MNLALLFSFGTALLFKGSVDPGTEPSDTAVNFMVGADRFRAITRLPLSLPSPSKARRSIREKMGKEGLCFQGRSIPGLFSYILCLLRDSQDQGALVARMTPG